jgi:uncharacterized protein involved in type VI secretion and phage assembly
VTAARVNGLVLGEVVDAEDPEGLGRVTVRFLSRPGDAESFWAPILRPLASGGFGFWFPPVVGDVVLVGFEDGMVERPYVLGAIYTGDNQPPSTELQERTIRTESGHTLTFDDRRGSEAIKIEDANGNVVTMEAAGVTIESQSDLTLKAVNITIEAQAQLTGKGAPIHLNP